MRNLAGEPPRTNENSLFFFPSVSVFVTCEEMASVDGPGGAAGAAVRNRDLDALHGVLEGAGLEKEDLNNALSHALRLLRGAEDDIGVAMVELLLEAGADANFEEVGGNRPLLLAAEKGAEDAVRVLLEKGADLSVVRKDGLSTVTLASKAGNIGALRALLRAGAPVQDKSCPLQTAVRAGKKEIVKALCNAGADLKYDGEGTELLTLHVACEIGNVEMVEILIEAGAQVDERCQNATPLMVASEGGHDEVVKKLVELGADVNAIRTDNSMALHIATVAKALKVCAVLLKNGAQVNALAMEDGITPLMLAATVGDSFVTKLLIEHGADVNLKDRNGQSALFLATAQEQVPVMKLLVQNGADVSAPNNHLLTPLHLAVLLECKDVVKFLVDSGAKDAVDRERKTALAHAIDTNLLEIGEILVKSGSSSLDQKIFEEELDPIAYCESKSQTDFAQLLKMLKEDTCGAARNTSATAAAINDDDVKE